MSVFVDDSFMPRRVIVASKSVYVVKCNMIADTSDELHAAAQAIGLSRSHVFDEGMAREHYEVTAMERRVAIANGAEQITREELVQAIARKRSWSQAQVTL